MIKMTLFLTMKHETNKDPIAKFIVGSLQEVWHIRVERVLSGTLLDQTAPGQLEGT